MTRKGTQHGDATPADGADEASGAADARTFERRLEALEAVVRDLEREDLPLEASIARYREGVEHLRACRGLLDEAEQKLVELMAECAPDGTVQVSERPLRVSERGLKPDATA